MAEPFVGRVGELSLLRRAMDDTAAGHSRTLLCSGPAGVGKTTLAERLLDEAAVAGWSVLRGKCLPESLSPYHPVREALSGAGLEHLLASGVPPRIEAAYIISHAGLLIGRRERSATGMDTELFTGMLTAVTQFIRDSLQQMGREVTGRVSTLGYGEFHVVAVHARWTSIAAILTGRENEFLIEDMERIAGEVEAEYGDRLEEWSGLKREVEGSAGRLGPLFSSEKYEGVDWAQDEPKSRQYALHENVTRRLIRLSRERPVLLFLDDLHWADQSTLGLMHYLTRNALLSGGRVLLLGTYRPGDTAQGVDGREHPVAASFREMGREGLMETVEVGPLHRDEAARLLEFQLVSVKEMAVVAEELYRQSEGNPLFHRELLRVLVEEGHLVSRGGTWEIARPLSGVKLPSRIYDVIARRLARLPREQRELLEAASVLGETFTADALEKMTAAPRLPLLKGLHEAERGHGLVAPGDGGYRFSHVKIREVLYSGLPAELRKEYHRLAGAALAGLHGDSDEAAASTGYHFYMAGDAERAVPLLVRAVEVARGRFSNREAARCGTLALELMDGEMWRGERAALSESMGDVEELAGNYDDAMRYYSEAVQPDAPPETRSRLQRKRGSLLTSRGDYNGAMAELEKGLEAAGRGGSAEAGRLLSAMGLVHERRGDYEHALASQNEALKAFARPGMEREAAEALHRIGACNYLLGEYAGALECYERSLALRKTIGDIRGIGNTMNNIALVFADRGDYDRALAYHEKILALREKLGDRWGVGYSLANIGVVLFAEGEFDRALEFHEKSLSLFERLGEQRGVGFTLNNVGATLCEKGEYDRALKYLERSMALREKLADMRGIGITLCELGTLFHEKGEYGRAIQYLERCVELVHGLGTKWVETYGLCGLGEALLKVGRVDDAHARAARALELARETGRRPVEGRALRILGDVAAYSREWAVSEERFEQAMALLRPSGDRKELALAHLEYGRMLRMKGDGGRAVRELGEAVRMFGAMRLRHRVEEAEHESREAGG